MGLLQAMAAQSRRLAALHRPIAFIRPPAPEARAGGTIAHYNIPGGGAMRLAETIDLPNASGAIRLSGFQITTFLLCAFVAMIDGFDTQAIALAAPQIAGTWLVEPAMFGGVFASGLLGALVGALGFGVAADPDGRQAGLFVDVLLFRPL